MALGKIGEGSGVRLAMDWEASYKTARDSTDKKPVALSFISEDISGSAPLNQSQVIRGNRNPSAPYEGNKDVTGNLVVPVDTGQFGYFLRAAIDKSPDRYDVPATDRKTGSPTVTISSGVATFSAGQTSAAVGDRVLYSSDGGVTVLEMYLISEDTADTIWTVNKSRDGAGDAPADVTAATVVHIIRNSANSTPGTVTIASGTATFSASHSNAAAGALVIYNVTSKALLVANTGSNEWTVQTLDGGTPANVTDAEVETIELSPYFKHVFKVHATADLPSFVLEKKQSDFSTPTRVLFGGCKANSLEFSMGGDDQLTCTVAIVGASSTEPGTDYDSGAGTAIASKFGTQYENKRWTATEGGSAINAIKTASLTISNNLDTDGYTIGGGGERGYCSEGLLSVTGTLSAIFDETEGAALITKAKNGTETSLVFTITPGSGNESLEIKLPEVRIAETDPGTSGPAGIMVDLNFEAYYENSTEASAVQVSYITSLSHFGGSIS